METVYIVMSLLTFSGVMLFVGFKAGEQYGKVIGSELESEDTEQ